MVSRGGECERSAGPPGRGQESNPQAIMLRWEGFVYHSSAAAERAILQVSLIYVDRAVPVLGVPRGASSTATQDSPS